MPSYALTPLILEPFLPFSQFFSLDNQAITFYINHSEMNNGSLSVIIC